MNTNHTSGFYTDEFTGEQIEERCNCDQERNDGADLAQAQRNLERIARKNSGFNEARQ